MSDANANHPARANTLTRIRSKRGFTTCLGVVLLLQLLGGSQVWVRAQGSGIMGRAVDLTSTGLQGNKLYGAALLVQLAAGAVVLLGRRVGRVIGLIFLGVIAGANLVFSAQVIFQPDVVARAAAREATGVITLLQEATVGPWAWVCVRLGVLPLVLVVLVLPGVREWSVGRSRYEVATGSSSTASATAAAWGADASDAQGAPAQAQEPSRDELIDLWDEISRDNSAPEQDLATGLNRDNL